MPEHFVFWVFVAVSVPLYILGLIYIGNHP